MDGILSANSKLCVLGGERNVMSIVHLGTSVFTPKESIGQRTDITTHVIDSQISSFLDKSIL